MPARNWNKIKAQFAKTTDKLGRTIDGGIIDVVVGLNLNNIHTISSCEGHLQWGIAGPWIDIEADIDTSPLKERAQSLYHKIEQDFDRLTEKQIFQLSSQARKLQKKAQAPHLLEREKLLKLLSEFYQTRKVPYQVQLHAVDYDFATTRLCNIGASIQESLPAKLKERNLKKFQAEIRAFGDFLKNK